MVCWVTQASLQGHLAHTQQAQHSRVTQGHTAQQGQGKAEQQRHGSIRGADHMAGGVTGSSSSSS